MFGKHPSSKHRFRYSSLRSLQPWSIKNCCPGDLHTSYQKIPMNSSTFKSPQIPNPTHFTIAPPLPPCNPWGARYTGRMPRIWRRHVPAADWLVCSGHMSLTSGENHRRLPNWLGFGDPTAKILPLEKKTRKRTRQGRKILWYLTGIDGIDVLFLKPSWSGLLIQGYLGHWCTKRKVFGAWKRWKEAFQRVTQIKCWVFNPGATSHSFVSLLLWRVESVRSNHSKLIFLGSQVLILNTTLEVFVHVFIPNDLLPFALFPWLPEQSTSHQMVPPTRSA